MLLAIFIGALQAQTSPDYIFGSDNGAGWNWTTGTQGTASLGSSYKWQFAATATADHFFKFGETASNGDGSGFWVNSSSEDMNYTGGGAKWTAYYRANMGDGGAVKTAITSGNYYVVKARKQAGNDIDFAVFDNGASAPVTISSVTRTISSNDLTVTATASAAAGTNEKIWLRYSKDNWTTSTTTEMTFTSGTSYAATLNLTSGDFVSYYVLTTINQTAAPAEADADFFTVNYNNNSDKNYTVQIGPLSGNYYIPQGTNAKGYSSLANAFANINEVGLNGTVYLYIDDNLSETGANLVLQRNDLNATNNLVIKPAPTKTPTITISGCTNVTGPNQYAGLTLNDNGYVTIDGSNTDGGTTKDLTVTMNDGTNGRNVIQLYGNCDNITFKNLKINYQTPMSTSNSTRGIYLNGQISGASDNVTIDNCNIGDATLTPYYATGITGNSGNTIYCTNITIKNNNLYGRIRPVYFYFVGTSGTTSEIYNNNIYTYGGTNGTTTYTIFFNNWVGTINVFNNQLPTLTTNNTVTSGIFGISALSAQTGATCNIYNNTIGGDLAVTGTGIPTVISLMYLQDNGTYNVYHNSFNYPSLTNNTERSCIHISGASAVVNLYNNIITNNTDASNAYCIWKSNGTLTSNFNDLYVSGSLANVGYVGGAPKKTLADWQVAGYDANSKSKAVNFVSATDLSLTGASIDDIDLAAPAIDLVTTDIFGNARHTPNVYMGAHEPSDLNDLTSVENTKTNSRIIRTASGIAVTFDGNATIELYNINGSLIEKTKATGKYSRDLESGVYIIRINGKTTKFVR